MEDYERNVDFDKGFDAGLAEATRRVMHAVRTYKFTDECPTCRVPIAHLGGKQWVDTFSNVASHQPQFHAHTPR